MGMVNSGSYKEFKYCPVCSFPLTESKLLAKDAEGFISFQVGCKNGHSFVLTQDARRRDVVLRAWATEAPNKKTDTGLDA